MAVESAEIQCPKCQAKITVEIPTKAVFLNEPNVSAYVVSHEKPETCPSCGVLLSCRLVRVKPTWGWLEVKTEKESGN